ncbi:MAG: nitrilase [Deferribacterales bacterium]
MKIALLQMKVEEDYRKNIEKVVNLVSGVRGAIVVLPELFTTGFNYDYIGILSDNHHEVLSELPNGNTYIGSIVRKVEDKRYNSFFLKNDKGYDFPYDKTHLFPLMDEDKHFTEGKGLAAFRLNGAVCGCAICFDLRFPEMFRIYFKSGIEVFFLPAEWPASRKNHLITLATARAIENQSYMIFCNAVGNIWGEEFPGESSVINPYGEVELSMGAEVDKLGIIDIDLDKVREFRNKIPIKDFLRADIYGQ